MDPAGQLSLLQVLSAAVASMITTIIGGLTSVFLVQSQLAANKELEDHRGAILGAIKQKEIDATTELTRQGHKLGLERFRIENRYQQLLSLRNAAVDYRAAVGSLSRGKFDKESAYETLKQLAKAMDLVKANPDLSSALQSFRQRGLLLIESGEKVENENDQMNLWNEASTQSSDEGKALGVCFGSDAEKVVGLLSAEDERVLKGET